MASSLNAEGSNSSQPPTAGQAKMSDLTPLTAVQFWAKGDFNSKFRLQYWRFPLLRQGNNSFSAAHDEEGTIVSFVIALVAASYLLRGKLKDSILKKNGLPITVVRAHPETEQDSQGIDGQPSPPEPPWEGPTSEIGSAGNAGASRKVIAPPHKLFVVFPRLWPFKVERIKTVGEFVAFFHQLCEVRPTATFFVP